jgi:hypothetical protein
MTEEFRKMRPDLNLPPARRGQAPADESVAGKISSGSDEQPGTELVVRKDGERSEDVQRKIQTVRETAREQPKTIANMLKKYTNWNRKK